MAGPSRMQRWWCRAPEDRRAYLARWITAPDNALFARTVVNRVWANFFGRGLVHPVDDLRATNPASNDALFEAVTRDFVAGGFDVRRLIRTIMLSAAYQRSAEPNDTNRGDDRYYSRYLVRRLPAEVILDALSSVTGVPEDFSGYAPGTRALQLPDTEVDSYFLDIFGRPERIATSAAERMQDPTLTQALHAINGDTLRRKLQSQAGLVAKLAQPEVSNTDVIDRLYLAALSRRPTEQERTKLGAVLAGNVAPTQRRETIEDMAWAVLTSKEFLFNH
jgi:hypothetical protein